MYIYIVYIYAGADQGGGGHIATHRQGRIQDFKLGAALKKIAIQTLNNFINNNIDEQKLQDGKDNIIGGFALQTASNANIPHWLGGFWFVASL
jgi:hypothetical protein